MPRTEHLEAIEKRLWSAAGNLRANFNYASNEYFLPVMVLIFPRHAHNRFLAFKENIGRRDSHLPDHGSDNLYEQNYLIQRS